MTNDILLLLTGQASVLLPLTIFAVYLWWTR